MPAWLWASFSSFPWAGGCCRAAGARATGSRARSRSWWRQTRPTPRHRWPPATASWHSSARPIPWWPEARGPLPDCNATPLSFAAPWHLIPFRPIVPAFCDANANLSKTLSNTTATARYSFFYLFLHFYSYNIRTSQRTPEFVAAPLPECRRRLASAPPHVGHSFHPPELCALCNAACPAGSSLLLLIARRCAFAATLTRRCRRDLCGAGQAAQVK